MVVSISKRYEAEILWAVEAIFLNQSELLVGIKFFTKLYENGFKDVKNFQSKKKIFVFLKV